MTPDWMARARMHPVLQSEAAECGLAAVTMVAQYHGHRVNLAGLRQRFAISMKGATLSQLIEVGAALDLAGRAVRLDLDELDQLQRPAILHWDLNHFVVLESVRMGRSATILDPAGGRRTIGWAQLGRHFTGVALELSPTTAFRPIEARPRTRLSDLWTRIANFRGAFTQVLVLSIVLQATALLMPFYMQIAIDDAFAQADANLLLLLAVGFGVVYTLNAVTGSLRAWVMLSLGQSLSFHLGGNVVRHLIRLPLAWFERRHIGDLMSRVGSIQPIQELLSEGLVSAIVDAALVLTTLVVMFLISPVLAGIVLVSTLLYLGLAQALYPALRRRSEEEIVARAGEETYLMETIRAIRSVKIHAHEPQRESGWRNRYAEVVGAGYRARRLNIGLDLGQGLLSGIAFVVGVYVGGMQVIAGTLTVGTLLAFLAYRTSFVTSAEALVEQYQAWRLLGLHLDRLSDIVTERREDFPAQPRRALLPGPAIRLDALSFAYSAEEAPTLDAVDLEIPAGAFVAVVGPSGAGKSTLMRLLLGLLKPDSGGIAIDGQALTPATMAAWRGRIGAVMQDDALLAGTLADNIAFFDASAQEAAIEQAAALAQIHDDIAAMPMGYQTLVGDMGTALSAGQRQRIMLARALYRDPDVLFLDEGTANLDPATEDRIADMVADLPITRVVIAHRSAMIDRATHIAKVGGDGTITIVPRTPRAVARAG